MHLSILSDGFFSDSVDDSRWPFVGGEPMHVCAESHREGLVRGLVFIAIAAAIIAFVTISGLVQSDIAERGFAHFDSGVPPFGPDAHPIERS